MLTCTYLAATYYRRNAVQEWGTHTCNHQAGPTNPISLTFFPPRTKLTIPETIASQTWTYSPLQPKPQLLFHVMPLLRAFNDPPFGTVEEVVDFINQNLQAHGPSLLNYCSLTHPHPTGYRVYAPQWRRPSRYHM